MNINHNSPLRLEDFRDISATETSFTDGLVLTIPDSILYHRGVRAKDVPMDITVENDGGLICFYGPGKAIQLIFEVEELRAIMRLFDTYSASVPGDEK